jgi:putative iron-dependent peroxidase
MTKAQAGILASLPEQGRYVFFTLAGASTDLQDSLRKLQANVDGQQVVVGLGLQVLQQLDRKLPLMREFPPFKGPEFAVPSTPYALCLWLRGDQRGELITLTARLATLLTPAFKLDHVVDAFVHQRSDNGHGRDLTGYEDGTENPEEDEAVAAGIAAEQGAGLDGCSYWALQQWEHDYSAFESMSITQQDHAVGRRRSDNEELDDAPESAHVKRTAQESFEPEAFVVRRSMPWWSVSPQGSDRSGLMFSAFGCSFDAFEAQMRRMLGMDDGISDGLFRFSRPLTGCYFWCPPLSGGKLDLTALGLQA